MRLYQLFILKSYAIRIYSYPIGVEYFFKKDDITQEEKIDKFRNATKKRFTEHMIKEYINSINKNVTRNIEKGGKIKKGYDFFNL